MTTLVSAGKDKYERYKDLLLKKEIVKKDAFQYEQDYIREFGDLINECFEIKIACIEKKKIINYCQSLINKGATPYQDMVNAYIKDYMQGYYDQLNDMLANAKNAKEAKTISLFVVKKIKSIYYRIAKLIHPDMNPGLANDEKIKELWLRTTIAYNCNSLKDLEELEVIINSYLEDIDYQVGELEIKDIEAKIFELNEEIDRIIDSDPYQYKYLLMDEEAVKDKKEEIRLEIKDYQRYEKELTEVIRNLKIVEVLN